MARLRRHARRWVGRHARRFRHPARLSNLSRTPSRSSPGGEVTPSALTRYASILPTGVGRLVVIIADGTTGPEIERYYSQFSTDRVVVLAAACAPEWRVSRHGVKFRLSRNLTEIHRNLAQLGPVDVLLNLQSGTGPQHLKTFNLIVYHVREAGVYVVPRGAISTSIGAGLLKRLSNISQFVGHPYTELDDLPDAVREHARSLGPIMIAEDFVVVGKRNQHLLKVRDEPRTTRLLQQRGLTVTAVANLRAGKLRTTGTISNHGATVPLYGLDEVIPFPPLFVRRYEGRIAVAPGAVVYHGHSILPDTFRWHLEKDPVNPRLENVDARFARLKDHHRPVDHLAGSYYYLEYSNSGHFGHLMTEALAKLWGWDAAKRADPDVKMLLRRSNRGAVRPEPTLDTTLLRAYGVAADDIVWVDDPVWVESLVGASPMWHNRIPYYAHPGMAQVWKRLRDGVGIPDKPSSERIFVSRRVGNRRCRNVDEVEALFVEHGYEIIHPEQLSITEQARVFRDARVIAGFGGSNLFNLLWAEKATDLVVLNQEAYDSRSEHLFATVLGVNSHYFWSTADLAQPAEGWSYDAFQSDFDFDFDRNDRALRHLLDTLA